jgi:hypothetical protein
MSASLTGPKGGGGSVRQHLKSIGSIKDLAMFNIALDAKLRGCDLVKLRLGDVAQGGVVRQRSTVIQQKTGTRQIASSFRAPPFRGARGVELVGSSRCVSTPVLRPTGRSDTVVSGSFHNWIGECHLHPPRNGDIDQGSLESLRTRDLKGLNAIAVCGERQGEECRPRCETIRADLTSAIGYPPAVPQRVDHIAGLPDAGDQRLVDNMAALGTLA